MTLLLWRKQAREVLLLNTIQLNQWDNEWAPNWNLRITKFDYRISSIMLKLSVCVCVSVKFAWECNITINIIQLMVVWVDGVDRLQFLSNFISIVASIDFLSIAVSINFFYWLPSKEFDQLVFFHTLSTGP